MLSRFSLTDKVSGLVMQHIKHCLTENKVLKRLKEKLADNGEKKEIYSLLSQSQQQEIIHIRKTKTGYIVTLKSAYALYGIRAALRNFHHPIRTVVGKTED